MKYFLLNLTHKRLLWCSGYHVSLTHWRSPVRSWAATLLNLIIFFVLVLWDERLRKVFLVLVLIIGPSPIRQVEGCLGWIALVYNKWNPSSNALYPWYITWFGNLILLATLKIGNIYMRNFQAAHKLFHEVMTILSIKVTVLQDCP